MRSCVSAAATASFKLFTASTDTGKVSSIHGVELWNPQPESQIGLLRFRVPGGPNPPNLFLLRRNSAHSVVSTSSSYLESQHELELADEDIVQLQLPDSESSWMVHVKLQLQRECRFGEQFLVAGDHPTLGMWNPLDAAPMVWSDGHVWTTELDLPVGQLIEFKFILRKPSGKILWQPGPNRILQTTKTSNTIRVFGEWENVTVQHVVGEHWIENQYRESDELMIDEMRPMIETSNGDIATFKGQTMAMVAENITYHAVEDVGYRSKKLQVEKTVEISGNVVGKKVILHTAKDEIDFSNTGLRRGGSIIDINGETQPDLVPGLSPCLTMATEDVTAKQVELHLNTSAKLDQKQGEEEDKGYRASEGTMTELILNNHGQMQQMNKPGFAEISEPHRGLELVPYRDWGNKGNGILHSSIKWGQETLGTFLNNLGFGFIFRAIK